MFETKLIRCRCCGGIPEISGMDSKDCGCMEFQILLTYLNKEALTKNGDLKDEALKNLRNDIIHRWNCRNEKNNPFMPNASTFTRYCIIQEYELSKFIDKLNRYLSIGWELYDGTQTHSYDPRPGESGMVYIQALTQTLEVKENEPK